jgi:uncharacterized membrane protein HdeD (DUF308 family)
MLRDFWRLVMLEGTGLVVIGIAAVILPQLATLAIDLLVGWLLFIAGLFRFASIFSAQDAPGYWGSMLLAALTALLGALLALWPTAGILTLTMVLAVYLTAHGIASLTVAGALRGATDLWFWIGLGALADFLLAGLVIAGWPSTAAWAMGLYIGINLTTSGLALILAAIAFCILMERLAAGDVSPGP